MATSKLVSEILRQLQARAEVPTGAPSIPVAKAAKEAAEKGVKAGQQRPARLRINLDNLLRKRAGLPPIAPGVTTPGAIPTGAPGSTFGQNVTAEIRTRLITQRQRELAFTGLTRTEAHKQAAKDVDQMLKGFTQARLPGPSPEPPEPPGTPPSPPSGGPTISPPPSFRKHRATKPFKTTTGGETPEGGVGPAQGRGIVILEGTQQHPPHTLMDKHGRHVHTDRWFDSVFLCYDAGLPVEARGGRDDPMMGLHGREFSVYYPASTRADWKGMLTSGSSGRWLNSWALKSSYVRL